MSRRDELRKVQAGRLSAQRAPKATQVKAEKICGLCSNYSEGAFSGEGAGSCRILKVKSDISADPPKYDLESTDGYQTMNLMDAGKCQYYEKMSFVDKDGTECSDPRYRRSMRQMQD
ncbi:MAG: hypothetical protein JEZ02_06835 [Desulfatibacillum sp.]|nr:hypothetical protein [Desulfatibacillum sp.]